VARLPASDISSVWGGRRLAGLRQVALWLFALLACGGAWAQTATLSTTTTALDPSGGTAVFNFTATYPGSTVFSVTVNLPSGWRYLSGSGEPGIKPEADAQGAVSWLTISPLASPVSFSFSAYYPPGLATASVTSSFTLSRNGQQQTLVPSPVVFGSAPLITAQPTSQSFATGATITLTFSVTGTAPLSYQWRKNGADIGGATSPSLVLTSLTAAGAGSYTVVVTNPFGSVTSSAAVLTLASSGGGGGVIPPPAPTAPSITQQPASRTVALGGSTTFTVGVDGTAPLTYAWSKNGAPIAGATSASFTIPVVAATDAGSYAVVISNSVGSVASTAATLIVTTPSAPAIATPPAAQLVNEGEAATFTVAVSGTAPFTYQWRKNDAPISGATAATYSLARVTSSDAGSYSVVVSNALGSVTSSSAALTVRTAYAGSYFGTVSTGGSLALNVRPDRTGVLLIYFSTTQAGLVFRDVVVDASGHFRVTTIVNTVTSGRVAAAAVETTIDGTISAAGIFNGTVTGLGSLTATRSGATGVAQSVAGFYQAGAANSSATSYAIVSPVGQAFVLTVSPSGSDAGTGTVDAAGRLIAVTANNASVTGTLSAETATLTASVTGPGGARTDFLGGSETRVATEKLLNIATRGAAGGAAGEMIAGFVVRGDAAKPVLIRAVGPTLATFGVGGALSSPRLELFRDGVSLGVNTGWADSADIAATAARVGAFALAPGSRDAALLVSLSPGAYTAVVSGSGAVTGVVLVEVYDASPAGAAAPKIVNIASRGLAGTGDSTLTAGFVVAGSVPKRVLIRGVGPTLAAFGVPGTLADPQLKLLDQPGAVIATNDNWATPANAAASDATLIAAAASATGAFSTAPASKDAALLLNLAPGAYTVQVSGTDGGTGVALVEVYEVP
jgi:hypothetical protein